MSATNIPSAAQNYKLTPAGQVSLPTAALAIDALPDGTMFVACMDGGIYRVSADLKSKTQIGKHASYASGVQVVSGQNLVVSAGYDGTLNWLRPIKTDPIRTVQAHNFWSWRMRTSADGKLTASVTGQYTAGGYKYEPAPEKEPSVRVYDTATGKLIHSLPHVPPTLSVAFSPDSRLLAAANIMGEVRIWDTITGKLQSTFTTPDFTCWGIIKSHHYIGGVFDMRFSPDGTELLLCGMGPMIDPMAGNGKQLWQRYSVTGSPKKLGEIADKEGGHGLMEAVLYHPDKPVFLMAGRLAQGNWNTALLDRASGKLVASTDAHLRITGACWLKGGDMVALCGATSQERPVKGICPNFGHIKLFSIA